MTASNAPLNGGATNFPKLEHAKHNMTKKIVILGAGMAGLGAAHRLQSLGVDGVIYEKLPYPGGHTASHTVDGFTFDEGPHISFTKDGRIKQLLSESAGGEVLESKAVVNNYWQGTWIPHPAQTNLRGLPSELLIQVLKDFIEAQNVPDAPIRNYQDWLYASFGRTFAETFPMKYTEKYHTTVAANLTTDWVGPRIYRANLEEVLRGALSPTPPNVHYITEFRYPVRNGFVAFLSGFIKKSSIRLGHSVSRIDPVAKTLHFSSGLTESYEKLISSMPLTEIIPMIQGVPNDVKLAAQRLACSEVVVVTLGVDRALLTDAHWSYFYDHDIIFSRLSTPHMQSPNNVPPGCGSFQAEVYFSRKYKPLTQKPEAIIEPVIQGLRKCGLLTDKDRILFKHAKHVPYANVIFDQERAAALHTVHGYLGDLGIECCGRYGEWAYIWTDESFVSGENAAQKALG